MYSGAVCPVIFQMDSKVIEAGGRDSRLVIWRQSARENDKKIAAESPFFFHNFLLLFFLHSYVVAAESALTFPLAHCPCNAFLYKSSKIIIELFTIIATAANFHTRLHIFTAANHPEILVIFQLSIIYSIFS